MGFSTASATAVCNTLGFTFVTEWYTARKWRSQDYKEMALSQVSCDLGMPFEDCSYSRTPTYCTHEKDIFLVCSDCKFNF